LLTTLYLQDGRGLSPVLTGLCFLPQAVGAFALSGPAGRLVPTLGPRRALAIAAPAGSIPPPRRRDPLAPSPLEAGPGATFAPGPFIYFFRTGGGY
jgi:hypothetical protein